MGSTREFFVRGLMAVGIALGIASVSSPTLAAPLVVQFGYCWANPVAEGGNPSLGFGTSPATRPLRLGLSVAIPTGETLPNALADTQSVRICRVLPGQPSDAVDCSLNWTVYDKGTIANLNLDDPNLQTKFRASPAPLPPRTLAPTDWITTDIYYDWGDAALNGTVLIPVINDEHVARNAVQIVASNGFCAAPQLLKSADAHFIGVPSNIGAPTMGFPAICQSPTSSPNLGDVVEGNSFFPCTAVGDMASIGVADYTSSVLTSTLALWDQMQTKLDVARRSNFNGLGPPSAVAPLCNPNATCVEQMFFTPMAPFVERAQGLAQGMGHVWFDTTYNNSPYVDRSSSIPTALSIIDNGSAMARRTWVGLLPHEQFHEVQWDSRRQYGGQMDRRWTEPAAELFEHSMCFSGGGVFPDGLADITCISASHLDTSAMTKDAAIALTQPETGIFADTPTTNSGTIIRRAFLFYRYVTEQYAYPVDPASKAHPTGSNSELPIPLANPANPLDTPDLLTRTSSEGTDLMFHFLVGFERPPSGSPVRDSALAGCAAPELRSFYDSLDCVLNAHLGRSLVDVVLDYHTALVLKDYAEIEPRWRFQWVDDFFANGTGTTALDWTPRTPVRSRKPFVDLTTGAGVVKPSITATTNGEHPDRLERTTRQLDSWMVNGTTVTANPFGPGATVSQTVGLASFGSSYASILPLDPATGTGLNATASLTIVGSSTGTSPRFRVFLVDTSTSAQGIPVELATCRDAVGGACSLTNGRLSLQLPLTPSIREVLLVSSAGYDDAAITYTFAADATASSLDIVRPTAAAPAFVGNTTPADKRRPFTLELNVLDSAGLPINDIAVSELKLTVGGVACEACVLTQLPGTDGRHAFLVSLDPAVYQAVGTVMDLGVQWGTLADASPASLIVSPDSEAMATSLAIDLSLSMSEGQKLQSIAEAARMMINSHLDGVDSLGLVTFQYDSNERQAIAPLSPTLRGTLDTLLTAILTESNNGTSVGDGILRSQAQLSAFLGDAALPAGVHPNIILLSDGGTNCLSTVEDYIYADPDDDVAGDSVVFPDGSVLVCDSATATQYNFPVLPDDPAYASNPSGYTARTQAGTWTPRISSIGVGDASAWASMAWLAQLSGGSFIGIPLSATSMAQTQALGEAMTLSSMVDALAEMRNASGDLHRLAAGNGRSAFEIESGTELLLVSVATTNGSPQRRLVVPGTGELIAPTYSSSATAVFRIASPPTGTWTWEAIAEGGDAFVDVSVRHPIKLKVLAGPGNGLSIDGAGGVLAGHLVGLPIRITAVAHEAGLPIANATALTMITRPSGAQEQLSLYDDGAHGDGLASDGVFSNQLRSTAEAGPYQLRTVTTGVRTSTGQAFRREVMSSTALGLPADADLDGLPDYWEATNGVTDPNADDDADGLINFLEYMHGTKPLHSDSDHSGEADGSEVAAGRVPGEAADDQLPDTAPTASPGNAKVILGAGYRPEWGNVQIQHWSGTEWIDVMTTPVNEIDRYEVAAENGTLACHRLRILQGTIYSAWSQSRCATPLVDPFPPHLDVEVARCQFDASIEVSLIAYDPDNLGEDTDASNTTSAIPSEITEYRLVFGDWLGGNIPTATPYQPFEPQIIVDTAWFEAGSVSVQVRDASGQESEFVRVSFENCTCPAEPDFDDDGIGDLCDENSVVANAGLDQTVECTANGAAPATVDGSASGAPSGDLTYNWTAPIALQGQNQATASGTFPTGTTTVQLTVSANGQQMSDITQVTVVDTTRPTVTPPPDVIAASCTNVTLGTPTGSDSCSGVTFLNDAPSSFKAGVTLVNWRSRDAAGNESLPKVQIVTVGLGDNSACCPAGSTVRLGTSNNDVINGGSGRDCIIGKGGQDTLKGNGGDDLISGGEGDDAIEGNDGNDYIEGGNGQDTLKGLNGVDVIIGNGGDDICWGGSSDDRMYGGQGQDTLYGEANNDRLFGEDGDDRLEGSTGDDYLEGGGLHDTCLGGTGTNTLVSCETVQ